jgi:hypothetical protein
MEIRVRQSAIHYLASNEISLHTNRHMTFIFTFTFMKFYTVHFTPAD